MLAHLEKLFNEADADGTGFLDKIELSRMLVGYYKAEKMARSLARVRNEVCHRRRHAACHPRRSLASSAWPSCS